MSSAIGGGAGALIVAVGGAPFGAWMTLWKPAMSVAK